MRYFWILFQNTMNRILLPWQMATRVIVFLDDTVEFVDLIKSQLRTRIFDLTFTVACLTCFSSTHDGTVRQRRDHSCQRAWRKLFYTRLVQTRQNFCNIDFIASSPKFNTRKLQTAKLVALYSSQVLLAFWNAKGYRKSEIIVRQLRPNLIIMI